MTELGSWITKHLEMTDRTIDDLAKSMGIEVATLGDIINGRIKRPPDARLSAMAKFFDVSVDTIRGLISGKKLDQGMDIRQGDQKPNRSMYVVSFVHRWNSLSASIGDAELVEILIIPAGWVSSTQGDFLMDQEAFSFMRTDFENKDVQPVIDFEHQSLGGEFAPTGGGPVPAAGWIQSLRFDRDRGVIALVKWNATARQLIRSDQYRYPSPVLLVRKSDQRAVKLDSVGLTNRPAIQRGLERLAARNSFGRNQDMKHSTDRKVNQDVASASPDQLVGEVKAKLQAIGVALDDSATIEDILRAVLDALPLSMPDAKPADAPPSDVAMANARRLLGLAGDAKNTAVFTAIETLRGQNEELVTMRAEVNQLKEDVARRDAAELLQPFVDVGKLTVGDDRYKVHFEMAMKDPENLMVILGDPMDGLPPQGRITPPERRIHRSSVDEDKMIAQSIEEHDGNVADGYVALQLKLKRDEEEKTGMSGQRVLTVLADRYPKVFA